MLNVSSENRNDARKLLTFCGLDSRIVRTMTLAELGDALQRAINEGLVTRQQVDRMLSKKKDDWRNDDNTSGKHRGEDHGNEDESEYDQQSDESSSNGNGDASKEDGKESDGESDNNGDGKEGKSNGNGEEGNADGEDGDGESESESDAGESDEDKAKREAYERGKDDGQQARDHFDPENEMDADELHGEHGDEYERGFNDGLNGEDTRDDESSNEDESNEDDEDETLKHESFKTVLKYIRAGLNVALVGPAGTGKSYIARQVADELELDFYVNGAMMSKYDLIGYNDAHGTYHSTPAHDAFKHGGVHCFDELDASAPDAVVAFNGMTDDQPFYTFPCGQVEQHSDYVAIACMNTWGNGASADYVGRYKQDAASMSRFVKVFVGYDRNIEAKVAGKHTDILHRVWSLREACEELGIRHIVSTRMIVQATRARELGKVTKRELDRDIFFAGLDDGAIRQLKTRVNAKQKEYENGNA